MTALTRLQTWYAQQCNGLWEHSSGVQIESCDNPGWWVRIDLIGTHLQTLSFPKIAEGVDAQNVALNSKWLCCHIKDNIWHGAGDETKLEHILETFLTWAEANRN